MNKTTNKTGEVKDTDTLYTIWRMLMDRSEKGMANFVAGILTNYYFNQKSTKNIKLKNVQLQIKEEEGTKAVRLIEDGRVTCNYVESDNLKLYQIYSHIECEGKGVSGWKEEEAPKLSLRLNKVKGDRVECDYVNEIDEDEVEEEV